MNLFNPNLLIDDYSIKFESSFVYSNFVKHKIRFSVISGMEYKISGTSTLQNVNKAKVIINDQPFFFKKPNSNPDFTFFGAIQSGSSQITFVTYYDSDSLEIDESITPSSTDRDTILGLLRSDRALNGFLANINYSAPITISNVERNYVISWKFALKVDDTHYFVAAKDGTDRVRYISYTSSFSDLEVFKDTSEDGNLIIDVKSLIDALPSSFSTPFTNWMSDLTSV